MQKIIQFKKERELGDVLGDTFKFVRENYKLLFKALVKFAGPVFLIQLFATGYYTFTASDLEKIFSGAGQINPGFGFNMVLAMLFMFITSIAYQAFMYGTIQHSIKSYVKNNGEINLDEVGHGMNQDWGSFLGLGFVIFAMVFAGIMFCFIPGIYLMVPLSLAYSIKTFDRLSFSETISHCFRLVKDNWWITFFTLLVMGIIVYLMSMIFQIPALIYTMTKTFTAVQEGSYSDPSFMFDWVYLALSVVANAAQSIIFGILAISVAFIYFSLNEQKNHTGAYEAIDNLGKDQ